MTHVRRLQVLMNSISDQSFFNVRLTGQYPLPGDQVVFRRCSFKACVVSVPPSGEEHPRVSDVDMESCKTIGGALRGVWLKDCRFSSLALGSETQILGCIFENVVVSGLMKRLFINDRMAFVANPEPFQVAIQQAYSTLPLALDISGLVCPDLDIRGVPTRLIQINEREQFVVRKSALAGSDWRGLDYSGTSYGIALRRLEESDWEDRVLALPAGQKRDRALDVVAQMRERGLVAS
jgi:hypothetical protein